MRCYPRSSSGEATAHDGCTASSGSTTFRTSPVSTSRERCVSPAFSSVVNHSEANAQLNGMTSLWQSVGSTCGASTLDSINVLAGQKGIVATDGAFSLTSPLAAVAAVAGLVAYWTL